MRDDGVEGGWDKLEAALTALPQLGNEVVMAMGSSPDSPTHLRTSAPSQPPSTVARGQFTTAVGSLTPSVDTSSIRYCGTGGRVTKAAR